MPARTSEYLDAAADLLKDKGWIQGEMVSPEGYCLMGSLLYVCGGMGSEASFLTHRIVKQYCGEYNNHAAIWNDQPNRTKGEVIDLLRNAAAVERIKELALVEAPEYETV